MTLAGLSSLNAYKNKVIRNAICFLKSGIVKNPIAFLSFLLFSSTCMAQIPEANATLDDLMNRSYQQKLISRGDNLPDFNSKYL